MIRRSVANLHAYVPGEQPRDPNVVKLNTNENPYPPSPRVAEVLRSFDASRLRLYPDPVASGIRAVIASLHGCAVDNVFVGNGSDEVLALAARAFVERDGAIGFFNPSYSLYPVLAAIEDIPTRPVPLTPDFGWVAPAADAGGLFYLTNPNAPTSLLFSRANVEGFCARHAGVVLIDEAYVDFSPANCVDLALSRGNVLVARTLSKSYGLAGIRLGYALGAAPLIDALHRIKDSYNTSMLTQAIGRAALEDQDHLTSCVARLTSTRERVADTLRQRGWAVARSATNFLWMKPPQKPASEVFESLRARGIFVRYFKGPVTGGHLRVTVGTDAQMDALLAALG